MVPHGVPLIQLIYLQITSLLNTIIYLAFLSESMAREKARPRSAMIIVCNSAYYCFTLEIVELLLTICNC